MGRKRLAIFDMDGTLVDSSVTIANAINFVRSRLGLPPLAPDAILEKINDPRLNAVEYFYETDRFDPRYEAWFSEYYSTHHDRELRLYPGVRELLERLKERGCLLAVATNAYRRSTLESLRHLKLLELFDTVASYDDVVRGKPAPDMLKLILRRLGVPACEALFVGDGERDRMAAQAAGIDFVAVDWGFSDHSDGLGSVEALRRRLESFCFDPAHFERVEAART